MPHGRACPSPPLTGTSRLLAPHRASGLFQLRRPADGDDCAVGYATLTRDALGQPLARLILWTPEGTGSDGYFWAGDTYLLGNLIDATVEIVLDWRLETGEIEREESFPLAARETNEILYAPAEYDDDEVFAALADAIRPRWQVEPVEDATLEQLRTGTLAHDPFEKRFAHMHRWHRPT